MTEGWNINTEMKRGWIEIIVGGMYSGKTEELIRRLRRAEYAQQKIQVFKPSIDDRYHAYNVTSHNQTSIQSVPVKKSYEILDSLHADTQVVGIDEGQFFDYEIIDVVQKIADKGIRVLVAGLDTDWQAKPFGPMPILMATAENVTKQHAVCMVCGATASRTQRTAQIDGQVVVGSHGIYEARCREHFKPFVVPPAKSQMKVQTQNSATTNLDATV